MACNTSYFSIAVAGIQARWIAGTCSPTITLEFLNSDAGLGSIRDAVEIAPDAGYRDMPAVNIGYMNQLNMLWSEGLSISCVYRGKVIHDWNSTW